MKYLYLPLTALILTLSHIACSTDNHEEPIVDNDVVEMTIVAEQTRTHLSSDGSTVEWDATGEYLMVYQTTEGNTVSNKSCEASVVDGLAQFGVTFQSVATAQSFEYNAIYPASSVAVDATPAVDDVLFTLPVVQLPTSSSFDNSADLLVARRSTTTSQPESLSMAFKRLVAIGRLMLAGPRSAQGTHVSGHLLFPAEMFFSQKFTWLLSFQHAGLICSPYCCCC